MKGLKSWHIVMGELTLTLLLLVSQRAPGNVIGTVTSIGLLTGALTRSID